MKRSELVGIMQNEIDRPTAFTRTPLELAVDISIELEAAGLTFEPEANITERIAAQVAEMKASLVDDSEGRN